jgi:isopenicillin N synthase-like dioxygenase
MTPLTANHYPGLKTPPAPGRFRNDPHSDFTALTILHQDEEIGGLEVRHPGGTWVPVPPVPGSFVVNLGDLMARWTNGRWASTVHRVVHPPADYQDRDRISIAFFFQPNEDALIECIPTCADDAHPGRHRPIRAGDYFLGKARRAYLLRGRRTEVATRA